MMRLRRYRVEVRLLGRTLPFRQRIDGDWYPIRRCWTDRGAQSHARLFRLVVWQTRREVWETRTIHQTKENPKWHCPTSC